MSSFIHSPQYRKAQDTVSALLDQCRAHANSITKIGEAFSSACSYPCFNTTRTMDTLRAETLDAIGKIIKDALHDYVGAPNWPTEYQPLEQKDAPSLFLEISTEWELDLNGHVEALLVEMGPDLRVAKALVKAAWQIGIKIREAQMKPGQGVEFKVGKNSIEEFVEALIFVGIYSDLKIDGAALRNLVRSAYYNWGPLSDMASREKVALGHGIVLTNFKEKCHIRLPADWIPHIQLLLAEHASDNLRDMLSQAA